MRLVFIFLFFYNFYFAQAWLRLPDFPISKRDDGVAVVVGNKGYFGTGLQEGWSATIDFSELDFSTNTWSSVPNMPNTTERQYACAFAGNNCFYVFGGSGAGGALNTLWKYNITNRSWTEMTPKPGAGIIAATCFQFGNRVIIASGRLQGAGSINHEVWEYNLSTDSWQQKNKLPFDGRWRASGTVLHNFGYLLFGIDTFNAFRKELYRYDHNVDTWTKISDFPMAKGRAYACMEGVADKLFVFGGYDSTNIYYNDVWYYNDILNTWSPETNLPSFGRKGGMACVANNNFYYSCGISTSSRLNETWMTGVPLAIEKNEQESALKIYPVPTRDVLNIFLPAFQIYSSEAEARVLNVLGNEVLRQQITIGIRSQIDLRELNEGVYFVTLYSGNKLIGNKKIVKCSE
jgi:N-acetylneuraminic acid mutarotase